MTRVSQKTQIHLNGVAQDLTDYLFHTKDKVTSFSVLQLLVEYTGRSSSLWVYAE